MHIHTKYEVSILNPVARRGVHRCRQCQRRCRTMRMPTPDDNYARQANHDYIGLFGRIPNEPKTLISSINPRILNIYQVKKQWGCVNSKGCLISNKYGICDFVPVTIKRII